MHLRRSNPSDLLASGSASVPVAAAVSVVLLVAAGVAYRVAASAWDKSPDKHIDLPVPLKEIPKQIGGWTGEELEIEAGTDAYMRSRFADDYVSRKYVNPSERLMADVYVVYCSTRPAAILGHKPRICYPGGGWIWDDTAPSEFTTRSGRMIGCLIHSFHRPPPAYQQIYVLNFYVLNGGIVLSEKEFSSLLDRRPNLSGDIARYVAQVQISSVNTEYPARVLASQMADIILSYLPDQNGHVPVADAMADSTHAGGAAESQR